MLLLALQLLLHVPPPLPYSTSLPCRVALLRLLPPPSRPECFLRWFPVKVTNAVGASLHSVWFSSTALLEVRL